MQGIQANKALQTAIRITSLLIALMLLIVSQNSVYAKDTLPELKIDKLNDNLYLHTSFQRFKGFGLVASNGLVIVDDNNAFIIDTPASANDTKKLVVWLKGQGFTVKGSISTHSHDDSSAGIAWLNSNEIETYVSKLTNKLLDDKGKEQAKNTFVGTSSWLFNNQIEVFYPGAGHTIDNVVVWLPKHGVLFGGCFVKSKHLGNLADAVIAEWPDSAQQLISKYGHASMVVPGHGRTGDVSLLKSTKRLAMEANVKH